MTHSRAILKMSILNYLVISLLDINIQYYIKHPKIFIMIKTTNVVLEMNVKSILTNLIRAGRSVL